VDAQGVLERHYGRVSDACYSFVGSILRGKVSLFITRGRWIGRIFARYKF
jgi:hypothetical protein